MFLSLNKFEVIYPDFKVFVESLDLDVGSMTAVVGSNGSGKTALIEGILGVLQSTNGTKHWKGCLSTLDKENSGVQLQRSGFGDQMLVEDIRLLHKALYKKQESVFIQDFEIDELARKQYRNLSRGQKQRVDLFVAMAHMPSQIFLDEPKTGLDSTFSRIFMKHFELFASNNENSAIFACHSPEELQIADQILWLDQGEVKDFGQKETVFKRHLGEYKIDLKGLTDQQRDDYYTAVQSFDSCPQEPLKSDGELVIYGGLIVKEWAQQVIKSDGIPDYSISAIKAVDFLQYLTKKGC